MSDKIMLIEGLYINTEQLPGWPTVDGKPVKPTPTNVEHYINTIKNLFYDGIYVIDKEIIVKNMARLIKEIKQHNNNANKYYKSGNKLLYLREIFNAVKKLNALKFLREAYESIDYDYNTAIEKFSIAHVLTNIPIPVIASNINGDLYLHINTDYLSQEILNYIPYNLSDVSFNWESLPDILGSAHNFIGDVLGATGHEKEGNAVKSAGTLACTTASAFIKTQGKEIDCNKWVQEKMGENYVTQQGQTATTQPSMTLDQLISSYATGNNTNLRSDLNRELTSREYGGGYGSSMVKEKRMDWLPYALIGGGLVLGSVIYFTSKK